MGFKNENSFRMPEFNLLVKNTIIYQKLTRRKDEDPSTFDQWIIIDGLKMQVINRDTILLKHGAMGAYQRQFDTCHLETKLTGIMQALNEGNELEPYEDDEHQVEKMLEDDEFMQDDIEDFILGETEGVATDLVDMTMSEHNVPTLTD